ncbi:hypothetical protein [Natranaerofaba carboxydovora]|uniref:hypothetical protein n=1 Tax=Natranaerofaba carboxydovora TaxID=2742683 RepID=UPI001F13874C|nr:hypothetical protein [Natranaerofaba carboxydovora]UMZ74313.1 PQQ-like domain protein [Natranaerofaba carboxydovora]
MKYRVFKMYILVFVVTFGIYLSAIYLGFDQETNKLTDANKVWEIPLEQDHTLGSSFAELTPQGLLTYSDDRLFLINFETGEIIWEIEGVHPIVEDYHIEPEILLMDDIAVLPLDFGKPSLVKLEISSGEILWSHPIARNSPLLGIYQLLKTNYKLIAKGNFYGGDDHDSDSPIKGSRGGEGVSVHDYETGELLDAFSVNFGSIAIGDNVSSNKPIYYSNSEGKYYKVGKRNITGEQKWERSFEKDVSNELELDFVTVLGEDGEILWHRKGKLTSKGVSEKTKRLNSLYPGFLIIDRDQKKGGDFGDVSLMIIEKKSESENKNRDYNIGEAKVLFVEKVSGDILSKFEFSNKDRLDGFILDDKAFIFTQDYQDKVSSIKAVKPGDGEKLWERKTKIEHGISLELKKEIAKNIGYIPSLKEDETIELIDPVTGEGRYSHEGIRTVEVAGEGLFLNNCIFVIDNGEKIYELYCDKDVEIVFVKDDKIIVDDGDNLILFSI